MNFASWVILAIVLVVIGLAVRATFFPKKRKGGCCDTGDPMTGSAGGCSPAACAGCSCTSCHMKVEIKPVE